MTPTAQRARPDRYFAASVAQYLHELSGRHADEREHARSNELDRVLEARGSKGAVALAVARAR
jgi:hypothetical protein